MVDLGTAGHQTLDNYSLKPDIDDGDGDDDDDGASTSASASQC